MEPGDPLLPRTAPDGTPWPPEAGALWIRAKYLMSTREGREAFEVAKAFGRIRGFPSATSCGAHGRSATPDTLMILICRKPPQFCTAPIRCPADRPQARRPGRHRGEVDRRSGRRGPPRGPARHRTAVLNLPAAGDGPDHSAVAGGLICEDCVREARDTVAAALDDAGRASAVIEPEALAALDALGALLTAEQEFDLAVASETPYQLTEDGRPVLESDDPARVVRAWTTGQPRF